MHFFLIYGKLLIKSVSISPDRALPYRVRSHKKKRIETKYYWNRTMRKVNTTVTFALTEEKCLSDMGSNEHRKPASGRKWSPRELWIPAMTWMIGLMMIKLLLFCTLSRAGTSWDAMASVQPYVRVILSSFILSVPMGMFRRKWMQVAIFVAADAALLCESPVQAACAGWLLPGTTMGSISLPAWGYPSLSLTTIAAVIVALKYRNRRPIPVQGKTQYCGYLIGWSLMAWLTA